MRLCVSLQQKNTEPKDLSQHLGSNTVALAKKTLSMAASSRQIFRSISHSSPSQCLKTIIRFETTSSSSLVTKKTSSSHHQHEQEYSQPCNFLGSWTAPKDPKEAQAKLGLLRRDYAKQVRELRKDYFNEMELQRQEKQLKDEAKNEAIRIAKQERKAAKAAMSKARAAERQVFEEEFRQTLMKERAQHLESWRLKEKAKEEKKLEKEKELRKQSSVWIEETDMEKKILEAIVDSNPL
ncbi:hypothetical protein MKW94_013323 [Papaver nudicaule]|uniref:Stress response NST1-like protein n=1 Tax=Papaver nudicaule TaxID=74823 RepID=A0AA41RTB1_PAPNU|nr:hypothetical protein [Papaver nudicaule]